MTSLLFENPYAPYAVRLEMITPKDYVGPLMALAQDRRGEFVDMTYLTEMRCSIVYNIPLAEVVTDFFDELKSRSKGYASMEYAITGYRTNDLVLMEIRVNQEAVDPLALICHRDSAYRIGRELCAKLKELIPRQMFRIPIQACIGGKIIASEAISAYRKDVLAKVRGLRGGEFGGEISHVDFDFFSRDCQRGREGSGGRGAHHFVVNVVFRSKLPSQCYGGDISRKKKLLKKQADGKKRMKQFGSIEIPQSAFLAVLKLGKPSETAEED